MNRGGYSSGGYTGGVGPQGGYGQYPSGPQYGPHYGGPGAYPPQQVRPGDNQPGYNQPGYNQPGYNQPGYGQPTYGQAGYAQQGGYQRIPDSAHEHGLIQEVSHSECKVCKRPQGGAQAYVCHQCPLVLCYECGNAIFYGNKAKQVHQCPLALRVRNAWKCDLCQQHFRGVASFYCKLHDFDACSRCYVGF